MTKPRQRGKTQPAKPQRPSAAPKKPPNAWVAGKWSKKPPDARAAPEWLSAAAIRETIESIAIALVLALLIRAFEAEAFVVPTGSMAPTLMGRHKDVACPKCGYAYQVSASDEVDEAGELTGRRVISATCPMCRFTMDISPANPQGQSYPSYSGDRILAGRFHYRIGTPQRWDVAVFHYPLKAATDYVKRVAGLPNEAVRIQYGDVWTRPEGASEFAVARKPPGKVLAMMQPVYDNDYPSRELIEAGWPARWTPIGPADKAGAWQVSEDLKSFRTDGAAAGDVWLGYRQLVPGYDDWAYLTGASAVKAGPPKPQLITDFIAYDAHDVWQFGQPGNWLGRAPPPLPGGLGQPPFPSVLGLNWVGDLVAELELNVTGDRGEILIDLVKGGHQFLARLDLAKGTASLAIAGVDAFRPASSAGIRGPGRHQVRMANVDQQLLLWLDGQLVAFDRPTTYEMPMVDTRVPDREDLTPVRIGSRGAAAEVRHLKVFRDVYYIAQSARDEMLHPAPMSDFDLFADGYPLADLLPVRIAAFFSDPGRWQIFGSRRKIEFQLAENQFFMLGDNSAESKDSRLWDAQEFYVERELLIGEALVVYWPHSWNRIPGTAIPFPLFPNFARMRLVR